MEKIKECYHRWNWDTCVFCGATKPKQTQSVEELVERFNNWAQLLDQYYLPERGLPEGKNASLWLKQEITELLHSHTQAVAQDILLRSDELEVLCSKDGDKGTHQWRMFKHFRNKIVDTYIKSNPTNHE